MKVKELLGSFDGACRLTVFDGADHMYIMDADAVAYYGKKCETIMHAEDADGRCYLKGLFDATVKTWFVTPKATITIHVRQELTRIAY